MRRTIRWRWWRGWGRRGGARRVAAFAGIGNPAGFLHTVRSMGMEVVAGCWFDDHHLYRVGEAGTKDAGDFESLFRGTEGRGIEAWVTTLKDWVKLRGIVLPVPVWHVRIEAKLSGHELELLRSRLATLRRGDQPIPIARPVGDPALPTPP